MVPREDGVRLMAAAWRTHPADYTLAYRSSLRLWGLSEKRLGEMIAWAQVAVALRPDSPFAHNQLGHAWRAAHNWGEAEASIRRAIELGKKYPNYAGAQLNLGNVMLEKGDLDGARNKATVPRLTYLPLIRRPPEPYFNLGVVDDRRGDLVRAAEWYSKAFAVDPTRKDRQAYAGATLRRQARFEELAAGRSDPSSPREAIEFAELAALAPRRYVLAVKLYKGAFTAEPGVLDGLNNAHRFKAACCALKAAAGKDRVMTSFGVEEWSYLNGLALKWLKADLAQRPRPGKRPENAGGSTSRIWLNGKPIPGLASVRDPVWLGAMPPDNRRT